MIGPKISWRGFFPNFVTRFLNREAELSFHNATKYFKKRNKSSFPKKRLEIPFQFFSPKKKRKKKKRKKPQSLIVPMSNPEDSATKQTAPSALPTVNVGRQSPPPSANPTPDVEMQTPAATSSGVSEILSRWGREDLLKRRVLALRGFGLVFSLLAFLIMACNRHGDWKNFDKYEEIR